MDRCASRYISDTKVELIGSFPKTDAAQPVTYLSYKALLIGKSYKALLIGNRSGSDPLQLADAGLAPF